MVLVRRPNRLFLIALLICIVAVGSSGCDMFDKGDVQFKTYSERETTIHLPTKTSNHGDDDALMSGTLMLFGSCLWVTTDPNLSGYVVIWPKGTRVRIDDERITVVKPNGDAFADIGDWVEVGGGVWGGISIEKCGGPAWGGEFDGF